MKVIFATKNLTFSTEFNTMPAAQDIIKNLPLDSTVSIWGDEIYFNTRITASSEGETSDVEVGDVAYWPDGKCVCVFFGPTPVSTGNKPVPASPVVIVGRTSVLPDKLRSIKPSEKIRLTKQ